MNYFECVVDADATKVFSIQAVSNIARLNVMVVWTDSPAAANTSKPLVSGLDVVLHFPSSNASWLRWVLNPTSDINSLTAAAIRSVDTLNNIEQITVDN